jgi:hypothetical protein
LTGNLVRDSLRDRLQTVGSGIKAQLMFRKSGNVNVDLSSGSTPKDYWEEE